MATGIIRRRSKSRRLASRIETRPTPIKVLSVAAATTMLTVTFDQAVALTGVPQYAVDPAGPTPVSAELTSPTTLKITYSASIATITAVTIPYEDAAIRNPRGGFVQPYDGFPIA